MTASLIQRDRLYVQRELIAWAGWVRQGQIFPNALGFKSSTVEYALMRGETGGDACGGSKVPTRFSGDRNVETTNKAFWRMDEDHQACVSGVYLYRMPERRVATILDVSRHQVRGWLTESYIAVFEALTTKNQNRAVVNH